MRGDILKKKLMVLCAVAIMISTCLTGCKMNSGKIRFGSAGIGGTYQIFGDTFANLISSKSKKYNIEVKTTAGSAANLRLLSKDYIQMMLITALVFLKMIRNIRDIVLLLPFIQKPVRLWFLRIQTFSLWMI